MNFIDIVYPIKKQSLKTLHRDMAVLSYLNIRLVFSLFLSRKECISVNHIYN